MKGWGSVLLERADSLASLEAALVRVRTSGEGELGTIAGEAGVGKSSLLRSFTALHAKSERVLWGACDSLRTPRPLGPLLDLAPMAGPRLRSAIVDGASRESVFAATLAVLREDDGPRTDGPRTGDRTGNRVVIMVIEDAHWADEATLDLLSYLARRIDSTRALLLVSYRDDEIHPTHPLRGVLGDVSGTTRNRISLGPLSLPSVAALAADSTLDSAELHRLTGGNPFFVTESLAAGSVLPESVRDAVLARAARLTPAARLAVDACAISPGRTDLWLLDSIVGDETSDVDECIRSGMLVSAGAAVVFRHELGRAAVLDAIPPARRRDLHRRALRVLLDPPFGVPDSSGIAHHAEEAAEPDAVLAHAPKAAKAAATMGAHRSAAAHLAAALRYADRLPIRARAKLYEQRGRECFTIGEHDQALAAYGEALAAFRQLGEQAKVGELLARRSWPLTSLGRQPEAVAAVEAALAVLEPLGPIPELALAYGGMCTVHMLAREFTEAQRWGDRAIALSEELGCRDHLSFALIQSGAALAVAGGEGGLARVRRGIGIAKEEGWDEQVARGYSQIGSGAGEVRRYDVAVPALIECMDWSRERELINGELYATAWLARCEFELGHWVAAGTAATTLLDDPRCSGIARFTALTVLGRLRARTGASDVWPLLDEALALARRTDHLQRLWPVAAARAEAAWLEGRPEAEIGGVREVFAVAESLAYPWAVGELEFWLWRAGAAPEGSPVSARPFALHVAGRHAEAAQAWSALGCPYESAVALAEDGDPASLRTAFAILDGLGARPMLTRVSDRMRRVGVSPPRRATEATRANPHGLTGREMEVADLLTEGLTNSEVGAALYISVKTAGHHVSRILAKLGVSTRREAASVWARARADGARVDGESVQ